MSDDPTTDPSLYADQPQRARRPSPSRGYDRSPDYGGPAVTAATFWGGLVMIGVLVAVCAIALKG